ncbi:hypothetical protein ACA910_011191 [Epithemia clementina (nom. ined.)]
MVRLAVVVVVEWHSHCFWRVLLLLRIWFIILAASSCCGSGSSTEAATTASSTTQRGLAFDDTKACQALDRQGQTVDWNAPPPGVTYNAELKWINCDDENSCREWTISNCDIIRCNHEHSCRQAKFVDCQDIVCHSYASCQDARFVDAHQVNCGFAALNACMHANMQVFGLVLCAGPNACVADPETQITINVGANGVVQCRASDTFALSCKHLLVQVNHARRACIASSVATAGHCAVICEGEAECLQESIRFWVLPSTTTTPTKTKTTTTTTTTTTNNTNSSSGG